jgi:integrase
VYVFTYKGKPVTRCNNHAWRKALIRAGIEDFRWHDLRHTWASWHVQNGTPLHELQQLGGWSNYETVLRYAHLSSEHLIVAAERVYDTKLPQ